MGRFEDAANLFLDEFAATVETLTTVSAGGDTAFSISRQREVSQFNSPGFLQGGQFPFQASFETLIFGETEVDPTVVLQVGGKQTKDFRTFVEDVGELAGAVNKGLIAPALHKAKEIAWQGIWTAIRTGLGIATQTGISFAGMVFNLVVGALVGIFGLLANAEFERFRIKGLNFGPTSF